MSHLFKSFVARKIQDVKFQARVSESFLKEVVLTMTFSFTPEKVCQQYYIRQNL